MFLQEARVRQSVKVELNKVLKSNNMGGFSNE